MKSVKPVYFTVIIINVYVTYTVYLYSVEWLMDML